MKSILVSNIQHFSLHDGPGIRTTVFLMGCELRCPWCANPENLEARPRLEFDHTRCVASKGRCFLWNDCPILTGDDIPWEIIQDNVSKCAAGAIHLRGRWFDPQKLLSEILRDETYMRNGGVTFSGGEPLLQINGLLPVLEQLRKRRIAICFETSLCVSGTLLESAMPYMDQVYVDVKLADEGRMRDVVGGDYIRYRDNLRHLAMDKDNIIMRFPVVPGMTDGSDNIEKVGSLLAPLGIKRMELFSVHNLAEGKYKALGLPFHHFDTVPHERLEMIRAKLAERIENVKIISL